MMGSRDLCSFSSNANRVVMTTMMMMISIPPLTHPPIYWQIMAFISLNVAFLFSILAVAYFAEEFPKYTRDKFSKRDPRFDVSFGFQVYTKEALDATSMNSIAEAMRNPHTSQHSRAFPCCGMMMMTNCRSSRGPSSPSPPRTSSSRGSSGAAMSGVVT